MAVHILGSRTWHLLSASSYRPPTRPQEPPGARVAPGGRLPCIGGDSRAISELSTAHPG